MAVKKERRAAPRKPAARAATRAPTERSDEEIRRLIAEAAYFRAQARGFAPGYELEDWVQAEAEVKARIGRASA